MTGYKGTNNGKCLNLQYEVGKTYELEEGNLKICETGFHFCNIFNDVHDYYPFSDKDTVIYEIEALGEIKDEGDKSVTDKIRIIREIPKSEYNKLSENRFEYDENGNIIKVEYSNGYWRKYKYDEDGNKIKFEDSNGQWKKFKYDKKGNRIKSEDSNGYWKKYEYDEKGNLVKYENSNGYWEKYKYDENGNQIKSEDSNGKIEKIRIY